MQQKIDLHPTRGNCGISSQRVKVLDMITWYACSETKFNLVILTSSVKATLQLFWYRSHNFEPWSDDEDDIQVATSFSKLPRRTKNRTEHNFMHLRLQPFGYFNSVADMKWKRHRKTLLNCLANNDGGRGMEKVTKLQI
ncbi:hypothetical protein AVEN_247959-1 [Araneus ventricosus]|uniref:Uncharacterized protein n=1 Tax=Araneus ventricosus TaxID=182803 RepID=A0A4Y2CIB2_ARAVE|nr:hypothetical protein AVEN_247958-1 [Araneus ventricosus]GBM04090.1 hypothetical protein AVEN_247959-1 [Araneus ventricosus]